MSNLATELNQHSKGTIRLLHPGGAETMWECVPVESRKTKQFGNHASASEQSGSAKNSGPGSSRHCELGNYGASMCLLQNAESRAPLRRLVCVRLHVTFNLRHER